MTLLLFFCGINVSFQLNKHEIHFQFGNGKAPGLPRAIRVRYVWEAIHAGIGFCFVLHWACMCVPALMYIFFPHKAWCLADMGSCACMCVCVCFLCGPAWVKHLLCDSGIPNMSQQATNSPAWNTTLRSTHKERERERESEKFKENKSGRKEEEEKMQITEKAPFVCWIKVDQLKWNIHQNRHSWWVTGNGAVEERGVCDPGVEGVRGRVWLPDENQPGLGHLHTANRWAYM